MLCKVKNAVQSSEGNYPRRTGRVDRVRGCSPLELFKEPFSGKKAGNIRAKPLNFVQAMEKNSGKRLQPPPPPNETRPVRLCDNYLRPLDTFNS